jgi:hypothetical protein
MTPTVTYEAGDHADDRADDQADPAGAGPPAGADTPASLDTPASSDTSLDDQAVSRSVSARATAGHRVCEDTGGSEPGPAKVIGHQVKDGPLRRPPHYTRQAVTVLRALYVDPTVARDLRYLTTHSGLSRRRVLAVVDRLACCGWISVESAASDGAEPGTEARAEARAESAAEAAAGTGISVGGSGRVRHLYRLTAAGAHAAAHLHHDTPVSVFWWNDPRSPCVVATKADLELVVVRTTVHGTTLAIDGPDAALAVAWPMVEVTTGTSGTPTLWYATTRQRGVLLWHDAATGTILAARHPDVPAAPQPLTFTTPDGQPLALGPPYTRLRASDVRAAVHRWWDTQAAPDTLHLRPTRLRMHTGGP